MGRPKNFSREEVLGKAIPLFWKRGFAATGLQDLEKATGVNKSGLYAEFKDKEDLFLAALQHYRDTRKGRALLSQDPQGWGNIERFLNYRLLAKDDLKGCFAINSMRETALLPPRAGEMMEEHRDELKKLVLKNLAAEKTGIPPKALAEIISTFFSGICIEENLREGPPPLRKVKDFMRFLRSA